MIYTGIVLFLCLLGACTAEPSAPVLVWESTSSTGSTSQLGLAAFPASSNAQLKNMLDTLDTETLIMFIMNELNVEDFSGHPDAMKQLQTEFEGSQHIYAPSIPEPAQVPALLSSYKRVTVDVNKLDELKLAPQGQKTLLLVYINDKPGTDRSTALQQSDAIIARVLERVKKLTSRYSAVLTAKHTSVDGEEVHRVSRSLKAARAEEDEPLNFFNFTCVYVYTSAAPIVRFPPPADGQAPVLLMLNSSLVTANASECGADRQTARLTWSDVEGPAGYKLDTVTLEYSFMGRKSDREGAKDSISSWTLPEVTLTYSGTVGGQAVTNRVLSLDMDEVYAPIRFSYHCTSRKWASKNTTATNEITSVDIPGFQVEAFIGNGTGGAFGRAWDCTPFFTIPIWSGLFLSLILLLIFVWSMYMLASVPTSDRFDDPRGQPLHVPTSE